MYNFNDESSAIQALQNMLYQISKSDDTLPKVYSDGIYGEETAECVRLIQKRNSIPITGTVNYETFNCIKAEYAATTEKEARRVGIYPEVLKNSVLSKGDESTTVVIVQSMLHELSYMYEECESIKLNGIIDEETVVAIKKIQDVHGIEANGEIDILTWNAIVIEYEKFRNKD